MINRAIAAATLSMLVLSLPSCRDRQRASPRQPLVSPSGKYVLTVPIEEHDKAGYAHRWWIVTIADAQGNRLYRDSDSRCSGWHRAYWVWDSSDRVWLYNSDDGRVFFWEAVVPTTLATTLPSGPTWVKTEWKEDSPTLQARSLAPPLEVYPDSIRDTKGSGPR